MPYVNRIDGGHASLCPPYDVPHVVGPCADPRHLPSINRIKTTMEEFVMGRYLLLWLLGVPIPILVLIYAFGGLH